MEEIHDEAYRDDIGLLTQEDMAFIHDTVGRDILSEDELNAVLNNAQLRTQVLDSPALFGAMSSDLGGLNVSEFFYYSTLVRQVMLTSGIEAEEYTQNVASSLVRMATMRRKIMERADSNSRYMPLNLDVLVEEGPYGCNLSIKGRMDPYEMVLEGFIANMKAFNNHESIDIIKATDGFKGGTNTL